MVVRTQTPRLRQIRKTNLELIFSDHNAYCLPPCQNKCPSHIDIPGFLKANTEGDFVESARIFKRTIPFPSRARPRLPGALRGALPPRRGRGGHRHPRQPPLRRRPGPEGAGRRRQAAAALRPAARHGQARGGHRLGPGGHVGGLLPGPRRPRRDRLRARPGAGRHAPLRHPAVPPAQGGGPGGRVRGRLGPRRAGSSRTPSWAWTSPSTTSRTRASTPSWWPSAATTRTSWASPARTPTGVIDGLEYLRIATLGLPYPDHAGKRVVVIGGGFTSMDCSRTSVRQGCSEVTLVYRRDMKDMPAANEVHEMLEEGARAIFQAAPTRVVTDATGKVTRRRVPAHGPGRAGRLRAGGGRSPWPARSSSSTATASCWPSARDPTWAGWTHGAEGVRASSRGRLDADAVTFATGRPGVFGTGDVRTGAATVVEAIAEGRRASYAIDAYLQGQDLEAIRTRQTLAEPQPEFLSIVPYTARSRSRASACGRCRAEERNRSTSSTRSPTRRQRRCASRRAACSAPARPSATATCAARASSTARRCGRLEPAAHRPLRARSVTENRFTGPTTTTSATTATPSSCASRRAASTAAAAPTSARRSWARPATTSCAPASTRS